MLLYGWELVLPTQLKAGIGVQDDTDCEPDAAGPLTQQQLLLDDELLAAGATAASRQELEQAATENVLSAQEKQKADFEKRKNPVDPSIAMPPGSMVWLKRPQSSRNATSRCNGTATTPRPTFSKAKNAHGLSTPTSLRPTTCEHYLLRGIGYPCELTS